MSELMSVDCGDSLCIFTTDKTGQRANGGCHCLPPNVSSKVKNRIKLLLHDHKQALAEIEKLQETIDFMIENY